MHKLYTCTCINVYSTCTRSIYTCMGYSEIQNFPLYFLICISFSIAMCT